MILSLLMRNKQVKNRPMVRKSFFNVACMALFSTIPLGANAEFKVDSSVLLSQAYDDNLFRIDSKIISSQADSVYSDLFTKAQVDLGSSWSIKRQAFLAGLGLSGVRYQRNSQLDKALYNARLGMTWGLGSKLSGGFRLNRSSDVQDFAELDGAEDNSILTSTASANILWRLPSGFDLGFNASESLSENSLSAREVQDLKNLSTGVSLNYSTGGSDRIGLSLQSSMGTYPKGSVLVNTNLAGYVSDSVAVNYETIISGKSNVSVSVGVQSRSNIHQAENAHLSENINLNYQWEPTGKLHFSFGWYKNNSTSANLQASSYDTNGLTLSSGYRFSEKVSLNFDVKSEQKQYFATGLDGKSVRVYQDDDSEFGVGVSYNPLDKVSVGLNVRNSTRDSSRVLTDYQSQMWLLNVKVNF